MTPDSPPRTAPGQPFARFGEPLALLLVAAGWGLAKTLGESSPQGREDVVQVAFAEKDFGDFSTRARTTRVFIA
jgi:hypothetical protein